MASVTLAHAGAHPVAHTWVGSARTRRQVAPSRPSFASNPRALVATLARRSFLPVGTRVTQNARTLALPVRAEAVAEGPPKSTELAIQQASTAIDAVMSRISKPKPAKGKKGRKKDAVSNNAGFTDALKSGKRAQILVPLMDDDPKELVELTTNILNQLSGSASVVAYFGDAKAAAMFQGVSNAEARPLGEVDSMEMTPAETLLVLLVGPTVDQIEKMRTVANRTSCTCVLVNAEWDPDSLQGWEKTFIETFEIVYWHLPLAIQGFLTKSDGAVFKFVESGAPASTQWNIYWNGEVINKQTKRPSPLQLEQVLYNKAAEDSTLVKAATQFGNAKDAVSGFFGKKK